MSDAPTTGIPLASHVARPRRPVAGFGCLAIGVAAVITTAVAHFGRGGGFSHIPDLRLTVPLVIAAATAGAASVIRLERAWWQCGVGVALALSCLALGWITALAAIIGVVVAVVVILSQLM